MGRRRLPPASATCCPRSRTSCTGEPASSRSISASQPRERVTHEPEDALAQNAVQAETHAGRLLAAGAGPSARAAPSADDGEREGGAAGELGVRVRLERPVLPPQHESGRPLGQRSRRGSGGTRGHRRASPRRSRAARCRPGHSPSCRRSGRPTGGSGPRGGPSRPPRGTAGPSPPGAAARRAPRPPAPPPRDEGRPRERHLDAARALARPPGASRGPGSPCCARPRSRGPARRRRAGAARVTSISVHAGAARRGADGHEIELPATPEGRPFGPGEDADRLRRRAPAAG